MKFPSQWSIKMVKEYSSPWNVRKEVSQYVTLKKKTFSITVSLMDICMPVAKGGENIKVSIVVPQVLSTKMKHILPSSIRGINSISSSISFSKIDQVKMYLQEREEVEKRYEHKTNFHLDSSNFSCWHLKHNWKALNKFCVRTSSFLILLWYVEP